MQNGDIIRCNQVISACGVPNTYKKLIPKKYIPKKF